jgi:hypothetical protein
MSIKSIAAKLFAKQIVKKTKIWSAQPVAAQQRVFDHLIAQWAHCFWKRPSV